MKKIAVITSTRAEFGLLLPVIRQLRRHEDEQLRIELAVTGTHLSESYGMTIREIENSGERIDRILPIPVSSDTALDISTNQAETLTAFTRLFAEMRYDGIVILGDRYEMLAVAIAAGNTHTPIFHLCGGDTTEGAMDEWIRHAITKISYLHFATNEESRRRVIQLGEDPSRVFNYGSTSIDNILSAADMSKADALAGIGLTDCDYALCTYHPVTLEQGGVKEQIDEFLSAIESLPDLQFIVTKSNADQGGAQINALLDEAELRIPNLHVFSSLGIRRYLSLMKYCVFVLGNSSSGIIETPAFHVPTVNIGDRQRGRLQAASIINCAPDSRSILAAVRKAISPGVRSLCQQVITPYGSGNASVQIAEKILETVQRGEIDLKKTFYDLPLECFDGKEFK